VRAQLGTFAVWLGFAASVVGVALLVDGLARRDEHRLRRGRLAVFVVGAAGVLATVAMQWALAVDDFSLRFTAEHHARATDFPYTVTTMWSALEGSLLLWVLALGGYLVAMAMRFRARANDPLVAVATITGLVVAGFFYLLLLVPANPFETVSPVPSDGPGPNPLLQNHLLVTLHPPALYLGYVGFTIPFAFAVGALVTGRVGEGWLVATRRATLVAWGFLTIGIILGGWWSYEVLGWGGFWAWDPVENASLLPWLTATAFLHSVVVQERRGMLRVWNLSLVLATFALTIFGTFLTRSGVLESVHAFSSGIGPWLFVFFLIVVVLGIGLIGWRGDRLRSPGRIDSPVSREAAFVGNNLAFGAFAFVVLLGTTFPLVAEVIDGSELTVAEPYFDTMTLPLGLAILFLMAVAPALPWRAAGPGVLRRRLALPAWSAGITMAICVALGARGIGSLMAFGLAAFAVASIARQVGVGVAARRRAHDEAWPRAIGRTVGSNPRLYGGLVVHLGVVMIAIALAATSSYATERETRLAPGESMSIRGYTLTYLGEERTSDDVRATVKARVAVERDGDDLGIYAPALHAYRATGMTVPTPSVRTGLTHDLYLKLVRAPDADGTITLGAIVEPMVLWLWVGGGVMALGTLIALVPSRRDDGRRRRDVVRQTLGEPDGDVPDDDVPGGAGEPEPVEVGA
jgi:cytochrome c-type biogenesis protein CcmF